MPALTVQDKSAYDGHMNKTIFDFLSGNRVCALSVLLPDGSPHAAAVHFSHQAEPLELYISTQKTSRKCQALQGGGLAKASMVVGFSEEEWITLQMDGEVAAITDPAQLEAAQAIHYTKHPNSAQYKNDPETMFLRFTPNWWRYSDFNTKPMTVIGSSQTV